MVRKLANRFPQNNKAFPYILLGLIIIFTILLSWKLLPDFIGEDWLLSFKPALQFLLSGQNPYLIERVLIAPWGLFLLIPLSWMPDGLAIAALRIVGLAIYAFVAIRLGAKRLGTIFILFSPQVLHNLLNGNIDWLCFLGFVLPPQIGIFFLSLKPQIGFALALFWAVEAIHNKQFLRTFAPFFIVFAVSLLIFGLWPMNFLNVQAEIKASAWPISLPFGIVFLYVALKKREIRIAQAISPLLSPHVMFHSWATMLYALAPNTTELVIAVLSSWLLVGIYAVGF